MNFPLLSRAILGVSLLFAAQHPADAAWPSVDVQGQKVALETCGTGPKAVVLLHDGVLDASAYDDVWGPLCARYRVVRYDRRGYGRSPNTPKSYDAIGDLVAVMKAAGLSKATLIGSSAGGNIAVNFALAHPQAVDRLVLVGAMVSGFEPTDHFGKRVEKLVALLSSGNMIEAAKDPYILTASADAARARVVGILTSHPGNVAASAMIMDFPSVTQRLVTIKAPTLILTGEVDMPDIQAQAGALQVLIPNSKRDILLGGGHFIYLEQPKTFTRALIDFIG